MTTPVPDPEQVMSYSTAHLIEGGNYWISEAENWRATHQTVLSQAREMTWEGQAADAMLAKVQSHALDAFNQADALETVGRSAIQEAGNLESIKSQVISTMQQTEEAGFQIGPGWSLADTHPSASEEELAQRQAMAEAFATQLRTQAGQLFAQDTRVGVNLVQGGNYHSGQGHILAVDNEGLSPDELKKKLIRDFVKGAFGAGIPGAVVGGAPGAVIGGVGGGMGVVTSDLIDILDGGIKVKGYP